MNLARPAFARTTTFRLALLNAVLFAIFSLALLAYLYATTFGYVRARGDQRLNAEIEELLTAYDAGGLDRLNQSIVERAANRWDRRYFYLADGEGEKIAGDFSQLPVDPPGLGVFPISFEFDIVSVNGAERSTRGAEGRVTSLPNGGVLMVAYDTQEQGELMSRITRAVWTAAPIGLLLSLIGGVVISRTAARRADALARTAAEVMAGDLSRRAPVRGSGDEFDRLSERLNAMLERLESLVMATRHAGDALAHDLRSPLTRLRNRLETALSEPMSRETAEETLGRTLDEVDQVLATFNAILRLSRLKAGDSGRLTRLDASEIAAQIADLFEPVCEDRKVAFNVAITRNLQILGDRELISQALSNLLDNAVKYTPDGGAISFRAVRTSRGDVEFSVKDTGPGIPAHARPDVVKRFVRLEASRSEPGSGLGLALVDAVAELHKGVLDLCDGDGDASSPGLRAILRLPRAG